MKIEKKVWPEYFQKINNREKTFELRLNDFKCKPGDTLILKEWDPNTEKYSGRELIKNVTYVLKTKDIRFWPEEDIKKYGFQVISFK
jgi:ribosomal protein S17